MKFTFKGVRNAVPAICILLGLMAVFVLKSGLGWIFVIGGILLQVMFLLLRHQDRG
jgi:hypothetical protein